MKKGQAKFILPPAFTMAIGLVPVFLSILYAVITLSTNEGYLRSLAVTSFGIDLQALQALGNDINAQRDITDAGAYHLVFEGNQVYMTERGAQTTTFLYTQIPGFRFRGGEFEPKDTTIGPLKLYKTGKEYGVARPEDITSPYLLSCDTPTGPPLEKIALDPAYGYDDTTSTGSIGDIIEVMHLRESKYTLLLANTLSAGKTRFEFTRSNKADTDATIAARRSTKGDALISLAAGNKADNTDIVKAYYNNMPGSKRLACEMLNEIAREFNVPVRPIPVNTEYLGADDPRLVLRTARPAVLLEIGNAQKADSILGKTAELSRAINKGAEKYGLA